MNPIGIASLVIGCILSLLGALMVGFGDREEKVFGLGAVVAALLFIILAGGIK